MRTVNFDDLDDSDGTANESGTADSLVLGTALPLAQDTESDSAAPIAQDTGPDPFETAQGVLADRLTAGERAAIGGLMLPSGPRDWTEDYATGEGCYQSTCSRCSESFFGWKGRVECRQCRRCREARILPAAAVLDDHEALTFHSLTGDGTGEALEPLPDSAYAADAQPLPDSRDIHAMHEALQSPIRSLGDALDTVLKNAGRLTPGQVESLHTCLLELGADLDEDNSANYGPDFDMTAFIRRMIQTTKKIENRLYRPTEDGMTAAFTSQELGAIINANKNLMAMIAKNHDKVMGWERQRHVEASHMAAARQLPVDIQDKYLATLQAEMESRGL